MSLVSTTRALAALGLCAALLTVNTGTSHADTQDSPALEQSVTADEKQAPAGQRTVITAGHIDMAPRLIDGKLVLGLRDDTQAPPVWRSFDDVVLKMGTAAKMPAPEDKKFAFLRTPAGADLWVIPQVEIANTPWLGWSTQHPSVVEGIKRGVTLKLDSVQGPGEFIGFLQPGNFADPKHLWGGDGGAGSIWVDLNTHTHTNWVFTKPGAYALTLTATGEGLGGQKLSDTQTLRLAVGEATATDAAFALTAPPATPANSGGGDSQSSGSKAGDNKAGKEGEKKTATADKGARSQNHTYLITGITAGALAAAAVAGYALAKRARRVREQGLTAAPEATDAAKPSPGTKSEREG